MPYMYAVYMYDSVHTA